MNVYPTFPKSGLAAACKRLHYNSEERTRFDRARKIKCGLEALGSHPPHTMSEREFEYPKEEDTKDDNGEKVARIPFGKGNFLEKQIPP